MWHGHLQSSCPQTTQLSYTKQTKTKCIKYAQNFVLGCIYILNFVLDCIQDYPGLHVAYGLQAGHFWFKTNKEMNLQFCVRILRIWGCWYLEGFLEKSPELTMHTMLHPMLGVTRSILETVSILRSQWFCSSVSSGPECNPCPPLTPEMRRVSFTIMSRAEKFHWRVCSWPVSMLAGRVAVGGQS